ncbi:unnamed protein product [Rhizophagus irregularis]|uniref:Uncharacterized protein n=1 Tax=Rhizophagus irregularis TaxID=588596 RepID=A0A2N1N5P4_9GLOM|nr:hypothetical protein RhiirC2_712831 [Rhizophagus irregularis]CAB4392673.1 unnamed protein product [Rhizophagus irregularis]CAB5388265.1 unnamed protein product [Rhizophagus irregularis]
MYQVLNIRPHPSFRFIHEEHTSSKSSYSVVTNAREIYLIVVIVVAPSDSQRVIKRQQGLMDAKQLKEQFRLANINNEKVVCVLGAFIMNETEMNKSTIIFIDENYLVNKQVIDEVYLEASRPVMDLQEEMLQQDLRSISCYDDVDIDDCENLVIEELSEEEMDEQSSNQQQTSDYKSLLYIMVQVMVLILAIIYK